MGLEYAPDMMPEEDDGTAPSRLRKWLGTLGSAGGRNREQPAVPGVVYPPNAGPEAPPPSEKDALAEMSKRILSVAGLGRSYGPPRRPETFDYDAAIKDPIAKLENLQRALADTVYIPEPTNWEQRAKDVYAKTKLEKKDPMHTRALSDALIAFGAAGFGTGDMDAAGKAFGKAWTEGRNREEDRALKQYERELDQQFKLMGFAQKDIDNMTLRDKAFLDQQRMQLEAGRIAPMAVLDAAKDKLRRTHELEKTHVAGGYQLAAHSMDAQSRLATALAAASAKGENPKFDKDVADKALNALQTAYSGIINDNPRFKAELNSELENMAILVGYGRVDPVTATRKFGEVIRNRTGQTGGN